jgi:hypothetical protein
MIRVRFIALTLGFTFLTSIIVAYVPRELLVMTSANPGRVIMQTSKTNIFSSSSMNLQTMRAVSLMLPVTGLLTLDVVLYLGLPHPIGGSAALSNLVPILVLPSSIALGLAYGLFLVRRVTRNLEKTGFFRPTRKQILASVAAMAVVLTLYVWFIGFIDTIISPFLIGEFSLLASRFAAQSLAYLRWERRTGKSIDYEGVWGFRAVDRTVSSLHSVRETGP